MIARISKLKSFGVFQDYTWKGDLSEFKRFNLIYGWNRSGKTTISRVFESCEKKCVFDKDKFRQYPESGEYEIKTSDNSSLKCFDISNSSLHVKVFNKDFIDENIAFDESSSCNPIVYVSEEDIESKKQLEKLKLDKVSLSQAYSDAKKDKASKEEIKNSFLTGLGREIANLLFDKSYNKTKAESRISSIGVDNFSDKVLSDENKVIYETISKSDAKRTQSILSYLASINFSLYFMQVKSLLEKNVISELLERLKDPNDKDGGLDEDLNNWVKQGFDLHKTKNQFDKCLFCGSDLSGDFFNTLSKHFSKDYEELQISIELLIKTLNASKGLNIPEVNMELYPDLMSEYEIKSQHYNKIIKQQNDWIDTAVLWLEQKFKNPFDIDVPKMVNSPDEYIELLNMIIDEINSIFKNHNDKSSNHSIEVKNAKEKLELNAIAVALSEQDYKKYINNLKEAEIKEKDALDKLNINSYEISEKEKKSSNIGKAINEINKHLKEFFGRKEIALELDENKKGYIIKRNGQIAINLSEGEKTAIAFSYFIVKVKEKDFNIKDGIIFIDDPISSLDSNFIYHCYSLISTYFNGAKQLFISTHNFHLFNLIKEWFVNKNNQVRRENEILKENGQPEKPVPCEFYMIENYTELDVRKARIVELDVTLKKNKSEYHFLFSLLNTFLVKDLNYADFYTVGNVARRFFDIFADFKIPDSRNQKQKMEAIVKELNKGKNDGDKITDSDWNKAYKLVNEYSHNYDPTSAIEHKDKTESKEAIKILFSIVEKSDPKHYEILAKSI